MSVRLDKFEDRRKRKELAIAAEIVNLMISKPILSYFKIFGLNNFKDIGINFETPVKIVAAENGAGMTTAMIALYAILSDKPSILARIDFDSIQLKFSGRETIAVLKSELFAEGDIEKAIKLSKFDGFMLAHWSFSNADIYELLMAFGTGTIEDHPLYEQIYFDSPYEKEEINNAFERLSLSFGFQEIGWSTLQSEVKDALGETDVIYLPTYRRVEADLPEYRKRQVRRRKRSQLGRAIPEREDELINFGLGDVQEKIDRLLKDIKDSTLTAYSQISRNTLQELANKQPDVRRDDFQFEKDDIKVIFARLPEDNSAAESAVLKLIEDGLMGNPENKNLRNFLIQLVDAFNETRHRERTINTFIDIVNDYLSFGFREKELVYDKFQMTVAIRNIITNATLQLNNLSSGEKQIVSIFARLCLDRTRKAIILIDEPELSLSMDWQKALLPDLWMTGNCAQIVAITHSPFVFENDFDRFAGSMELSYSAKAAETE